MISSAHACKALVWWMIHVGAHQLCHSKFRQVWIQHTTCTDTNLAVVLVSGLVGYGLWCTWFKGLIPWSLKWRCDVCCINIDCLDQLSFSKVDLMKRSKFTWDALQSLNDQHTSSFRLLPNVAQLQNSSAEVQRNRRTWAMQCPTYWYKILDPEQRTSYCRMIQHSSSMHTCRLVDFNANFLLRCIAYARSISQVSSYINCFCIISFDGRNKGFYQDKAKL